MSNLVTTFRKCVRIFNYLNHNQIFQPKFRLIEFEKNDEHGYLAHISIINTKLTFFITVMEILADNDIVDQFSPRDVRTLTYLGTLDLNQPEYSIMAQRVIESNKIVFAIKNNTENKIVIKTANQIINEQSVISRMSPTDAVKIGYALGSNDFN